MCCAALGELEKEAGLRYVGEKLSEGSVLMQVQLAETSLSAEQLVTHSQAHMLP